MKTYGYKLSINFLIFFRNQGFGWIHIINQMSPGNIVGDVVGLKDAWEDLLASKRQVCKEL